MIAFKGQRWGVVGAGKTGLAVARFLRGEGAHALLVDDNAARLDAVASSSDQECRPVSAVLPSDADAWVISPGVPPTHPLVAQLLERGIAYGDLDLWQARRKICTIAVTGTNGKSTVTRLLGDMLHAAGMVPAVGGNLGTPAVALLDESADRAVLEVSSFQLYYARHFRADIAVLTNVAPDHLDWHRDVDDYVAAKRKLFTGLEREAAAVIRSDDVAAMQIPPHVQRWTVGWDGPADVRLSTDAVRVAHAAVQADLQVPAQLAARHDVENLGCAAAAALATGADAARVAKAAQGFTKLKYRFAAVATLGGVRYVNDSKATNLHAMIAAVRSAGSDVHLLVGGKDKGLDWATACDAMQAVKGAYAYGESRAAIAAAWQGRVPVMQFADLPAALAAAAAAAVSGDIVLLAPGTSSFDQYADYEARGAHFDALVKALAGGAR